ncbi:MAG: LysR family transcriptional regulator [Microbacteriaceae bacterium]|nr:LysR family transcriptional regulator [Microbacteriaceae bacterium]
MTSTYGARRSAGPMLDVNARQLRAFLAVARAGNITRASEALGLTPSPVGRAIREFEEAVGETLFVRDNRVTVMTDAAERLLPRVVAAIALLDGLAARRPGPLRVGIADGAPARARDRLLAEGPEAAGRALARVDGPRDELLRALQFAELDLVLAAAGDAQMHGLASTALDGGAALSWRGLDAEGIDAIEVLAAAMGAEPAAFARHGDVDTAAPAGARAALRAVRQDAEIDIPDVRVMVAKARHRSLRLAAESIGLTASPVARTLREVEAQLGAPLFERESQDVTPTPLMAALLPRAVEILALVDSMAPGERMLRVGVSAWSPVRYRDRLLAGAAEAGLPRIDIIEASQRDLLAQLVHGELDLLILNAWADLAGVAQRRLGVISVNVFSADEPVTDAPFASVADLRDRRVIALPREVAPNLYANLVRLVGVDRVDEVTTEQMLSLDSRMRRTGAVMFAAGVSDTALRRLLERPGIVSVPLGERVLDPVAVSAGWRSLNLLDAPHIAVALRIMAGPDGEVESL